jgi:putative flippase GtrA
MHTASDAEPQASGPETPGQRPGVIGRIMRAGATSIGATLISHGTFIGLVGFGHVRAGIASAIAFALGATFNYFVGRRVTWGRTNRPDVVKETLPYVIVVGSTALLSIGGTTLTEHLIEPLGLSHLQHTIVLEIAFIVSYGVVFLLKFALLDRIVFKHPVSNDQPS